MATKKKDAEDILDNFLADLHEIGMNDVCVYAVSGDNNHNISAVKGKPVRITASIAMLIKILAMETDEDSVEVAELIRNNLEKAEKQYKRLMKEEEDSINAKYTD